MSNLASLDGRETVYRERFGLQPECWVYSEGLKVRISRALADKMLAQGARLVIVG